MTRDIRIGGHLLGADHPPLVVAELSGNHGGSLDRALALVRAAAAAGAHAVKIQTYRPESMTTRTDRADHRLPADHALWPSRTLWDLYTEAQTPPEWLGEIFVLAGELGLTCFSSVFDEDAVRVLEDLEAPAYKIASAEISDLPLVRTAARTGKPVVLSAAMASLADVAAAVEAVRSTGNDDVVVLVAAPGYPADPADLGLRALPALADALGVLVGLSDHTVDNGPAVASVALGAVMVEKHLTLDRGDGAVDSAFSLEPADLSRLVEDVHQAWHALGTPAFVTRPSPEGAADSRRSLRVVRRVRAGDSVTEQDVRAVRPAGGLPPDAAGLVLGRTFRRAAEPGEPLTWDLV